jgi:hypothetical protein
VSTQEERISPLCAFLFRPREKRQRTNYFSRLEYLRGNKVFLVYGGVLADEERRTPSHPELLQNRLEILHHHSQVASHSRVPFHSTHEFLGIGRRLSEECLYTAHPSLVGDAR